MIGIFDSGVGGLTVLRALRTRLPSADVVYFGDTLNAPYGPRTRSELTRLTFTGLSLLERKGATSLISACNSVSASLAVSLIDALSVPHDRLIEMAAPAVRTLRDTPHRLMIAATEATIGSGLYQDAFAMVGKDVSAIALPALAGAIEAGADDAKIARIIDDGFREVPLDFDALVLACTHYPLVADAFRSILPGVALFDPAEAVAVAAEERLWPREAGDGTTRFLISRESPVFRQFVARLFPESAYTIEVLE